MAALSNVLVGTIDRLVRWVVVPVTGVIPFLVSSGILLVLYAAIWAAFAVTGYTNTSALEQAWTGVNALPLPIVGLAWLLFLPPMAGLWVWTTSWPLLVRLIVVGGLAGWNLLVFIPRRAPASAPAESSLAARES